jgi:hypothetical protein
MFHAVPNRPLTPRGDQPPPFVDAPAPRGKRPYKTLALQELGNVRDLTQGSRTVGNDMGVGKRNRQCLGPDAPIDTPSGPLAAGEVRAGDAVWTVSAAGERVATRVFFVRWLPAVAGHRMVRVTLSDGRTVCASGLHPTIDGRMFEALRVGDVLDAATVVRSESLPYLGERTYDLLPMGETGHYWANGVLIGTTLSAVDVQLKRLPNDADLFTP